MAPQRPPCHWHWRLSLCAGVLDLGLRNPKLCILPRYVLQSVPIVDAISWQKVLKSCNAAVTPQVRVSMEHAVWTPLLHLRC
jgi:hypothetical protein